MTKRHRTPVRRPEAPATQPATFRDFVALLTAVAGAVSAVAKHPEWVEEILKWIEKLSR